MVFVTNIFSIALSSNAFFSVPPAEQMSFKMTSTLDVSALRFCYDTFCIHHEPFHEIGVGMPCDRLQNENTLSMNILSECLSLHLEESQLETVLKLSFCHF